LSQPERPRCGAQAAMFSDRCRIAQLVQLHGPKLT
jgi:hypothetical protein